MVVKITVANYVWEIFKKGQYKQICEKIFKKGPIFSQIIEKLLLRLNNLKFVETLEEGCHRIQFVLKFKLIYISMHTNTNSLQVTKTTNKITEFHWYYI